MNKALVVVLAASVVCGVWLVWRLNVATLATADLEREREADRLEALGLEVEHDITKRELEQQITGLSSELQAAVSRATKTSRGRPVSVVTASTGEIRCEYSPPAPNDQCEPCSLRPGDRAELRTQQVVVESRHGNKVVVGRSEAWRLDPPALLLSGDWSAPITEASSADRHKSKPGWGFGAAVVGTSSGLGPGLAVAAPPVRLLGVQLELSAALGWALTGGPSGAVVGIVRP